MSHPVAIVGAGLAGLTAACRLHQEGVEIILLEARDRLGGPIRSAGVDGASADDGFDLGPSWFRPGTQPAMSELLEELALPSFAKVSVGDALVERDPGRTSTRRPSVRQEAPSMRVVGGMGAAISSLRRKISPKDIRLNSCVVQVMQAQDSIDIGYVSSNGHNFTLKAGPVLLLCHHASSGCGGSGNRAASSTVRPPAAEPVAALYKDWAADLLTATPQDQGDRPQPSMQLWFQPIR